MNKKIIINIRIHIKRIGNVKIVEDFVSVKNNDVSIVE